MDTFIMIFIKGQGELNFFTDPYWSRKYIIWY